MHLTGIHTDPVMVILHRADLRLAEEDNWVCQHFEVWGEDDHKSYCLIGATGLGMNSNKRPTQMARKYLWLALPKSAKRVKDPDGCDDYMQSLVEFNDANETNFDGIKAVIRRALKLREDDLLASGEYEGRAHQSIASS